MTDTESGILASATSPKPPLPVKDVVDTVNRAWAWKLRDELLRKGK